jgi:hypothetical protein
MATTKPKYGQPAGAAVLFVSEDTQKELRQWMKRKPTAELIRKIENAVTWNKIVREMPTPAQRRAALEELFRKSYALWGLLNRTDEYTQHSIRDTATLDRDDGTVVDPIHDAKQALLDLTMGVRKTQGRLWNIHRSGGVNKKQSHPTLERSLRAVFKKFGGTLTPEQVDGCIDVITDSLPT